MTLEGGKTMQKAFVEYRDVDVSTPLRQGDVLEAVDPTVSKWSQVLLVITADCDLKFQKHHDLVTCVPILTKEDYLLEMTAPRLRERLLRKPLAELQAILAASGHANITDRRVRDWLAEANNEVIMASIPIEASLESTALLAMDAIRLIDAPAQTVRELINALVEAQLMSKNAPKRDNALKGVLADLREPFTRPPGDALFIGSVAPGLGEGYFAYLRHLEQVPQPLIAIGPTRRDANYRRIARLEDRFTHALVQRFAMVFMPIGLPREYEEVRDFHAEFLGEL